MEKGAAGMTDSTGLLGQDDEPAEFCRPADFEVLSVEGEDAQNAPNKNYGVKTMGSATVLAVKSRIAYF